MTNPIQILRSLFEPRAEKVCCPLLPDYLKLDDGSTDFDWIIKYKRNAFGKWHYYADLEGFPICFTKAQAEKMVEYIENKEIKI